MLEEYLQRWNTGRTTLLCLLKKECMPKEESSEDLRSCLELELKKLMRCFEGKECYALDGDAIERTRSSRDGNKAQKTMDVYLFQKDTDDPLTLIECKYRIKSAQGEQSESIKKLHEEITKKVNYSSQFLMLEGRKLSTQRFVVMNSSVAAIQRFNFISYDIANNVKLPVLVVDTEELYQNLNELGLQTTSGELL